MSRDCENQGCGLHQHGRAIAVRLARANCHVVVNYFRQRKAAEERTPSGRLTTPDDVADVILFLCNPCTDQIVGQTIIVDGGYSILG